jgi:uncharacterized protein (DUF885 family)
MSMESYPSHLQPKSPTIFSGRLIALACLLFLVTRLPAQPAEASSNVDATEALYELFEAEQQFQQRDGGYTFPDVLPAAQKNRADFWRSLLVKLEKIPAGELSKADRINLDIFRYILEDRTARYEFGAYLIPFNAEGGFYNNLSYSLNRSRFDKREDFEKYHQRLRAFPQFMRDNIALLRLGIDRGITSPRLIAENYRVLIEPFLEPDMAANPLYAPYQKMPEGWEASVKDSIRTTGYRLIRDSVVVIYRHFDQFMKEAYLPASRAEPGIAGIPQGKAFYEQRVAYFTSLDISPEEVFQTGQQEVARIRKAMEGIIEEVGFEGSFSEFLTFLRTDPQFYVTEPRALLEKASYWAKKIDGQLPAFFNTLPRLSYGVQPVPAAIAPNYTGGRYSPGSLENHRAGNYWVNTYKLESRPLYVLPALTLHEAVPGHHLQMSLARELESQPAFRSQTYLSAFGEGWALYAEWLGQEMGIYETPYEQFGRLTYEMWRACRLVVDVGLHYKGWSREKALEFLSSNTALSLHECNTEINRYIGWPGQAVSYKMGELKIRELRKKAEAALGPQFNIREFHDVILKNGSVPLFILEELVEDYIQGQLEEER